MVARRPDRPIPPLDAAALERLALRYVERFATTRGKLAAYLTRKVRERGWDGDAADPAAIAERMAAAGYIDDLGFAQARTRSLVRRGYGARRIGEALRAARVGNDDAAVALGEEAGDALGAALAFARRRRIGPFAAGPADEKARARHFGAMLRAGHAPALARRIVSAAPGEVFDE